MRKQNKEPFMIIVAALVLSIVIIWGAIWQRSQQDAADEKLIQETYQTTGGAICPKRELWILWETPQRSAWRKDQEKQHHKAAEEEGNGCYYLK